MLAIEYLINSFDKTNPTRPVNLRARLGPSWSSGTPKSEVSLVQGMADLLDSPEKRRHMGLKRRIVWELTLTKHLCLGS